MVLNFNMAELYRVQAGFFFLNDPPPTEIYPLSLHDALPILQRLARRVLRGHVVVDPDRAVLRPRGVDRLADELAPEEAAVLAPVLALGHHRLAALHDLVPGDRKSTRLNSSHGYISYAVFCLK